jgi:hypothetical protein
MDQQPRPGTDYPILFTLFGLNRARRNAELALELAVENREIEVVHVLVEAGVNVNTTATAITPLVAAIEARDAATMTYLEDHGAREKP